MIEEKQQKQTKKSTSLTDIIEKYYEIKNALKEEPNETYKISFPKKELEGTKKVLEYALNVYIKKTHSLKKELKKFEESHPNLNIENISSEKYLEELLKEKGKIIEGKIDDLTKTYTEGVIRNLDSIFETNPHIKEKNMRKTTRTPEKIEKKADKKTTKNHDAIEAYLTLKSRYEISLHQTAITQTILEELQQYFIKKERKEKKGRRIFYFKPENPEFEIAIQNYIQNLSQISEETKKELERKIYEEKNKPKKEQSGLWNSRINSMENLYFSITQITRYFKKQK